MIVIVIVNIRQLRPGTPCIVIRNPQLDTAADIGHSVIPVSRFHKNYLTLDTSIVISSVCISAAHNCHRRVQNHRIGSFRSIQPSQTVSIYRFFHIIAKHAFCECQSNILIFIISVYQFFQKCITKFEYFVVLIVKKAKRCRLGGQNVDFFCLKSLNNTGDGKRPFDHVFFRKAAAAELIDQINTRNNFLIPHFALVGYQTADRLDRPDTFYFSRRQLKLLYPQLQTHSRLFMENHFKYFSARRFKLDLNRSCDLFYFFWCFRLCFGE